MDVEKVLQTILQKQTRHEKILQAILLRLKKLENRKKITEIDANNVKATELPKAVESQGKLIEQLADNVSSLVGLREAIMLRRRSIKFIWAALLCLGLVGTIYYIYTTTAEYLRNPTATKVELVRPPEYAYPPLILCPGTWLDTEKALSMGLTLDALKYSIAYIDNVPIHGVKTIDVESARRDFYKFYNAHNFSCLLDYFKIITVDLEATDSLASLANNPNSSYCCTNCNATSVEKVFVRKSMCYAFNVTPTDARHYREWSTAPLVYMKIQDRTAKAIRVSNTWKAYLMPDQHLTQPNFPSIALEPSAATTLKTTAQRFVTNKKNNFCYQTIREVPADYNADKCIRTEYSADRCIVKCLHKLLKDYFKCHIFWYSANDDFKPPSRYCNYLDTIPGTNSSLDEAIDGNETLIVNSEEGAACIKKCPYTCNRTVYTSTFDSQYNLNLPLNMHNVSGKAREQNMSFVAVFIDNTAIPQGGILTLTEVDTFSFSTLVSNVGGTLGLFVGGTIMTFFQLIMFLLNYCLDVRDMRKTKSKSTKNLIA